MWGRTSKGRKAALRRRARERRLSELLDARSFAAINRTFWTEWRAVPRRYPGDSATIRRMLNDVYAKLEREA